LASSLVFFVIAIVIVLYRIQKLSFSEIQISDMKLSCVAFVDKEKIPIKYTCEGAGLSPQLSLDGIPEGTQTLALILKDPDAPLNTFIHWVVWNIPIVESISENGLPDGSVEGTNSTGKVGYFPPCPPSGQHHYVFYLYALDTSLTLPQEATSKELEQTITRHVLGTTTLTSIFP